MEQGIQLFSSTVIEAVAKNKRFLKNRPAYILPFARIADRIEKSAAVREAFARSEGLIVPPVLIASPTTATSPAPAATHAASSATGPPSSAWATSIASRARPWLWASAS